MSTNVSDLMLKGMTNQLRDWNAGSKWNVRGKYQSDEGQRRQEEEIIGLK